jgi:hypothetical protein
MWPKSYKDYELDKPLVKQQVKSGKGIVGCEMHDLNGWGNSLQQPKKKKQGFIKTMIKTFFGKF